MYNREVSEFSIMHIPTPKSSGTLHGIPWQDFDGKYTNQLISDNPPENPINPIANYTTTIKVPTENHDTSVIDK